LEIPKINIAPRPSRVFCEVTANMGDDGMLMNFDLGDAAITAKPTFKGGRWKDRLTAKKVAQHRETKFVGKGANSVPMKAREPPAERQIFNQRNSNAVEEEYIGRNDEPRAPKRQRTQNEFREVAGRNSQTAQIISGKLPPGSIKIGGAPKGANGKPGQIISSLFSFNPSAKIKFDDEPEQEVEEAKPSNAPLSEEAANFVSLGLSRRLAGHLASKLEMKAPTAIQKAAVSQLISDDSDAFIQAQTGSGKTLAYLLPIVERIMAISLNEQGEPVKDRQLHRNSGLFAIVLAPTRELCKQISMVLDKLLRCAPWLVGTTVIGGESKQSEKARLRKGVNILIATPGRLADHLDNTEVLDVSTVRWLVLDEGDRLMELGFEEEIKGIVDKIASRAVVNDRSGWVGKGQLPSRRVTVLCSATMKMTVQKLGEISLKDAVYIQADPTEAEKEKSDADGTDVKDAGYTAPAQLKQAYAVVPAKLRLVTLEAVLKRAFARRGSVMKAIVFMSCADSVDFHFSLFSRTIADPDAENTTPASKANSTMPKPKPKSSEPAAENPGTGANAPKVDLTKDTVAPATAISNDTNSVILHKLHGSLAQNIRTATLKHFTDSSEPCVIICTDVASRGLDLPNVDYVIEYDPPFAAEDHVHRIGRTARAGKSGRALIFLLPDAEEAYIPILKSYSPALTAHTAEELLRKGFGGTGHEWEERATEWQLDIERWVLDSPKYLEMARRAYQSHIRAYATHVSTEREMFDMKALHLGHLAKAFGLRDKPGSIKVPGLRPKPMTRADRSVAARKAARGDVEDKAPEGEMVRKRRAEMRDRPTEDKDDVARRMKRKMMEHMKAASEFNIG
jgi:ATP-dependent RNA helicase DDX31/DBP7